MGKDLGKCSIVFVICVTIFMLAPVKQIVDSRYAIMLSQNLITYNSFKLDNYNIMKTIMFDKEGKLVKTADNVTYKYPYQIESVNGHQYYLLPNGSSVLSVPLVYIYNIFGIYAVNTNNTLNDVNEAIIQRGIASFLMASLCVLIFKLATCYLPVRLSLAVVIVSAFGTQIFSTASRALWSHTWGIFIVGIVICLLVRLEKETAFTGIKLGTLLSWLYFVRPTYSIQIIIVSIYIFMRHRKIIVPYILTGTVWLSGFIFYSWYNYGKLLPSYYQSNRLSISNFWVAFSGNLISPSRGILVFCPIIVFVIYTLIKYWKHLKCKGLVVVSISICTLHLLTISCFPNWYGGSSYGPRLMTDVLPWLILLSILGLHALIVDKDKCISGSSLKLCHVVFKLETIAVVILIIMSVSIHSVGAFSERANSWWHYIPSLNTDEMRISQFMSPSSLLYENQNKFEKEQEKIWDVKSPQFMAWYKPVYEYEFGEKIELKDYQASGKYLKSGWGEPQKNGRWTQGGKSKLDMRTKPTDDDIMMLIDVVEMINADNKLTVRVNNEILENSSVVANGKMKVIVRIPQKVWGKYSTKEISLSHQVGNSHNANKQDNLYLINNIVLYELSEKT